MTNSKGNKTVRDLIPVTADYFQDKGVESARLNAERLLADVLGFSRMDLFLKADRPVFGAEMDQYRDLVRRRAAGEPLQTIIGMTEFYSRPFKVVPGVFIPRPETEHLVEAAAKLLAPEDHRLLAPVALEVGCGTGIISISLACEVAQLVVHASDINPAAIELAGRNARSLEVESRVNLYPGSRFDPFPQSLLGKVDVLVSNPPYVRREEIEGLSVEVAQHDPREALDGGPDGLVFYRALAAGMARWLRPGGHIIVEIGDDQAEDVGSIFEASGAADIQVIKDYSDRDRVVSARLTPQGG